MKKVTHIIHNITLTKMFHSLFYWWLLYLFQSLESVNIHVAFQRKKCHTCFALK